MVFQIRLADKIIEIHSLYKNVYSLCSDYLEPPFAEEASMPTNKYPVEPSLRIQVTEEDIEREIRETARVRLEEMKLRHKLLGAAQFIKQPNDIDAYTPEIYETTAVYRKIATDILKYDTFVMHGSVVATQGVGYMFTAPSGVGKTTRTKLWLDHIPGSIVVNGDKPLLRVTEDKVYAYGTPWCGKENWNTNIFVPLRAIFLLERVQDGEDTTVTELRFSEAFPILYRQTFRPDKIEARRKTLHLLQAMSERVKLYRLRSDRTAEAVLLAWEVARPQTKVF